MLRGRSGSWNVNVRLKKECGGTLHRETGNSMSKFLINLPVRKLHVAIQKFSIVSCERYGIEVEPESCLQVWISDPT